MRDIVTYRIAQSMIPALTVEMMEILEDAGISPREFFDLPASEIAGILNLPDHRRMERLMREEALAKAEKERKFIERHNIRALYYSDDDYPFMLREIPDAPLVLYQLGETDLNCEHSISVVGTRRPSPYGAEMCRKITTELGEYFPDLMVVSGLAYGIDAMAHTAALESGLVTVGVVAHGLDTIYPAPHRDLARRIIHAGGSIISEYPSGTVPYQKRFLERNRIVAAISEMSLVVESPIRGGAMNTANSAFSYSHEVGAVPGRIGDEMSGGCNHLIRTNKAHLIGSAADIIETLGWAPAGLKVEPRQRNLFPELSGEPKEIVDLLKSKMDPVSIDEIHQVTGISVAKLLPTLTELEFDGIIIRYPGNRFYIN